MKGKRRRHDPEFKARVALEALKGVRTIQEIAKEFDVHPVQVSEWKKTMAKNAASAFGASAGQSGAEEFERERERLHAKIGQQAVELDWLNKKVQTTRSVRDRVGLLDRGHPKISMRKQCLLLGVARSTADYQAAAEDPEDIRIKRLLDEIYLIDPCLGSRRLATVLERDHGVKINRKRLDRLRREMGHEAIWCKPRTSIPDDGHRKYPYLLRKLEVGRPDQVWCADITYVPMPRGHAYLCAVMDWHSRKVLGWAVSNTMGTGLCLEALEMALNSTGRIPEIFNTDQGCQFTSAEWTGRLEELGVRISMDGRGRWMDNVFIERLWRSVKYEEIYLKEHATVLGLQHGLREWFGRYNDWRPHQHLGNLTPAQVYRPSTANPKAA
ncbi:MAG: IS3 family transposase [Luteolibacter sp.]